MKEKIPVTLIIPTYNRIEQTTQLLNSLSQAKFDCEIIIVDDNSSENINELTKKFQNLEIKYFRNKENFGPAYSRNVGIKNAKYDFVAFTDNDCIVSNDWLLRLYEYIRDSNKKIAGVGGRVIAKGEDIFSKYYTYHKILDPWFYNGRYLYLVTANAIFRKEALKEVNYFDETVKQAGGEDPGLSFKLLNKGYEFLYNPEAVIIHDYDTSLRSFIKIFHKYGFGCSYQVKEHYKNSKFVSNTNYGGINNLE